MKKGLLVIPIFVLSLMFLATLPWSETSALSAKAKTAVCGDIMTDTTWTLTNSPYQVTCNITIVTTATLTIQPGVEVQFAEADHVFFVEGRLEAVGSPAEPILFTGGDASAWHSLWFMQESEALISNAIFDSMQYIQILSSEVTLTNSTIRNATGSNAPMIINWVEEEPFLDNLTFENNPMNHIDLIGGILTGNRTLRQVGTEPIPYRWLDNVIVSGVHTLTIEAGVEVQFAQEDSLLFVEGRLEALGNAAEPILFTRGEDDVWAGIWLFDGSQALLDYVTIEYMQAGLQIISSDVMLSHSIVRHTSESFTSNKKHSSKERGTAAAIYIFNGTTPRLENNLITNNSIGLYVDDSQPIISNNAITGNTSYGVVNAFPLTTTVDARHNWWGDASGPYHATLNPAGLGDPVTDAVLFEPWLTSPPGAPIAVSITGAITGQVANDYTFIATVNPPTTTTPITYTWDVSGQLPLTNTSGITDTVTLSWNKDGAKVITLSASNSSGTVSDTHTIIISDATATPTPTNTPTASLTPTNTPTASLTPTNTPTASLTPTNTPTTSLTPTNTPTNTPSASLTPTNTPTNTPSASLTPTNTPTTSLTATNTPTTSPTLSTSPTHTATPTTVASSATPTATNTPTNLPIGTTMIEPEEGGELISPNGMVQLNFPPGAVSANTLITYTEQLTPSLTTGNLRFAGTSFNISATDVNGKPVTNLSEPFTMTVTYIETDWQNAGISDESELNIYWWNGKDWIGLLDCIGCLHDQKNNRFVIVLDHLSEFALLGEKGMLQQLYLPLLQK